MHVSFIVAAQISYHDYFMVAFVRLYFFKFFYFDNLTSKFTLFTSTDCWKNGLFYVWEEFVTPLSTPPSEAEDAAATEDTARQTESVTSGLSESAIYDKIYET